MRRGREGKSDVLSEILAAVTQRPFLSERQIREVVLAKRHAIGRDLLSGSAEIGLSDLRAMLVSIGDEKRTWLVADPHLAYLVLDDRNWEDPRIQFWAPPERMLPVHIVEGRSGQDGVLTFGGDTKLRRYSTELFLNDPPKASIERFLSPVARTSDVPT